jgi:hypothetical protein
MPRSRVQSRQPQQPVHAVAQGPHRPAANVEQEQAQQVGHQGAAHVEVVQELNQEPAPAANVIVEGQGQRPEDAANVQQPAIEPTQVVNEQQIAHQGAAHAEVMQQLSQQPVPGNVIVEGQVQESVAPAANAGQGQQEAVNAPATAAATAAAPAAAPAAVPAANVIAEGQQVAVDVPAPAAAPAANAGQGQQEAVDVPAPAAVPAANVIAEGQQAAVNVPATAPAAEHVHQVVDAQRAANEQQQVANTAQQNVDNLVQDAAVAQQNAIHQQVVQQLAAQQAKELFESVINDANVLALPSVSNAISHEPVINLVSQSSMKELLNLVIAENTIVANAKNGFESQKALFDVQSQAHASAEQAYNDALAVFNLDETNQANADAVNAAVDSSNALETAVNEAKASMDIAEAAYLNAKNTANTNVKNAVAALSDATKQSFITVMNDPVVEAATNEPLVQENSAFMLLKQSIEEMQQENQARMDASRADAQRLRDQQLTRAHVAPVVPVVPTTHQPAIYNNLVARGKPGLAKSAMKL